MSALITGLEGAWKYERDSHRQVQYSSEDLLASIARCGANLRESALNLKLVDLYHEQRHLITPLLHRLEGMLQESKILSGRICAVDRDFGYMSTALCKSIFQCLLQATYEFAEGTTRLQGEAACVVDSIGARQYTPPRSPKGKHLVPATPQPQSRSAPSTPVNGLGGRRTVQSREIGNVARKPLSTKDIGQNMIGRRGSFDLENGRLLNIDTDTPFDGRDARGARHQRAY